MPLYEYECPACGGRFERIQRFADPPLDHCLLCGKGPVQKLLSAPAVHFKGTGWYVTDYASKKSDGSPRTDAGAPKTASSDSTPPASSAAASSGSADEKKPAAAAVKKTGDSGSK